MDMLGWTAARVSLRVMSVMEASRARATNLLRALVLANLALDR
jgi:hypothetical protein